MDINKIDSSFRKRKIHELQWEVTNWDGGQIHLPFPHRLWKSRSWDKWGKMQAEVLSAFREHWQQTYVYIRFQTHVPDLIAHKLESCSLERFPAESKREGLFLIPDCENVNVWESVFASVGIVHLSRTFYMLDKKPTNWQSTIENLYGIINKLSDRHSPSEFEEELSGCRCLIYSSDNDMMIGKIDLKDEVVYQILKDIAERYQLEISLKKDTRRLKNLSK